MQQLLSGTYRVETTVGELSHTTASFDISARGSEIARFFEMHPDAPGVIITNGATLVAGLSQTAFLRALGRQFGSELFHRRPIQSILDVLRCKPMLIFPADYLIHDVVNHCLAREDEVFGPFLVEKTRSAPIQMVDFRTLVLASSEVFALRNQHLAEEIQQRKLLEHKLLRAQRMETIGLLAGGVAHNLNNTLAPIMMASSMLNSDLPYENRREFITTIEESAQRAAEIIQQMLVFARGLDGKQVAFQPQSLIGDVTKFINATFPKSISLHESFSDDLWLVKGDQTQLHQVLLNLCVNAKDSMMEGGLLTFHAENCDVDESFDGLTAGTQPGNFVRLDVTDTGTGIPREIIEKIFDPFFTTKEVNKGTGLGLSTVVGIVRSHGGFLKVDSELGKGSTFSVFLPASQEVDVPLALQPDEAKPQGHGELILVVDDEKPIRHMTQAILQKNGYEVVTANDGDEALRTYGNNRDIKLVLTDVSMPVMDGVALSRALKAAQPKVKIVAASGRIEKTDRTELSDLGVKTFLMKPYRMEQLLKAVHEGMYELAS